jgi:hypothetical protein
MGKDTLPVKVDRPVVPEVWDYYDSVNKVKATFRTWKTTTKEMLEELWIAKQKLKVEPKESGKRGRNKQLGVSSGEESLPSWSAYVEDCGLPLSTVDKWLQAFEEGRETVTKVGSKTSDESRDDIIEGEIVEPTKSMPTQEEDEYEDEVIGFNVKKTLQPAAKRWRDVVVERTMKALQEDSKLDKILDDSLDAGKETNPDLRVDIADPLRHYDHLRVFVKVVWTRKRGS